MILQKKNIHMVKVYDNIIPGVTCKKLLDLFEKNEEHQEYINEDYCPCFTQLNLNQLSSDIVRSLVPYVQKVYQKYIRFFNWNVCFFKYVICRRKRPFKGFKYFTHPK